MKNIKNFMKDLRKLLVCSVVVQSWTESGVRGESFSITADMKFFDVLLAEHPKGARKTIIIGDKVFEEK